MVGGSGGPPIRYDAVDHCLHAVAEHALAHKASVHMLRIGCGLTGGKWERIEPIIGKTLSARDIAPDPTYVSNFWASWDLLTVASVLAIGILRDDQAKVDQAVTYFKSGAGKGSIKHPSASSIRAGSARSSRSAATRGTQC